MMARSIARRVAVVALGWAACAASPSLAQEPTPVWTTAITQADFDRLYPPAALENGQSGEVNLGRRINEEGGLVCAVVRQEPEGWGFAEAALGLAAVLRAGPQMSDGSPSVDQDVELDFVFDTGAKAPE
jgi:hypothetical protein